MVGQQQQQQQAADAAGTPPGAGASSAAAASAGVGVSHMPRVSTAQQQQQQQQQEFALGSVPPGWQLQQSFSAPVLVTHTGTDGAAGQQEPQASHNMSINSSDRPFSFQDLLMSDEQPHQHATSSSIASRGPGMDSHHQQQQQQPQQQQISGGSGDLSGYLGGFGSPGVYRTSSGKVLRMLTHPVTGKPLLLGPAVDAKSSRLGNTSLGAPAPQLFGMDLQATHLNSLPAPAPVPTSPYTPLPGYAQAGGLAAAAAGPGFSSPASQGMAAGHGNSFGMDEDGLDADLTGSAYAGTM
ncbi:hypothetical protein OEZ85_011812 [Tetradesmus obliquus]|uniref:Uncharacterized protein n=1 Tax=Tetradesmus obliquus TaxID=3088 RepID=A0ABY8TTS6_TETOB|nr:hypothetical protein OEZ85_011812 [Tetradesmus obliquus]